MNRKIFHRKILRCSSTTRVEITTRKLLKRRGKIVVVAIPIFAWDGKLQWCIGAFSLQFFEIFSLFLQKGNLVLKMKMEPQITDGKRFPKLISNPIQVSTSRWWSSILGHFLMPKKYLWQSHWPIFIFHQKKWLGLHGLFESDDVVVSSSQIGTVYILNVPKVWLYIVTQSCY